MVDSNEINYTITTTEHLSPGYCDGFADGYARAWKECWEYMRELAQTEPANQPTPEKGG